MFLISLILLSSCSSDKHNNNYQENYVYTTTTSMKGDFNTEEYNIIEENPIQDVLSSPLSTFSIDVDTASYANVRRFLNEGSIPPKGAIRTEEMINYFTYDYPSPEDKPLAMYTEVAPCPWNDKRNLAMITIQGEKIDTTNFPQSNLVFLIDVSGSMSDSNKLPLVKSSLRLLVNHLREDDLISIVVYAGSSRVVLEPTRGNEKDTINQAIDSLQAGGSTAGGSGIQLAYEQANKYFAEGGNNRVILTTDGDFNVGVSSDSELEELIEEKRDDGIFLSVLGFGTGNYKDSRMELLADKGNGNYAYIDSFMEAKKVLVEQMSSTLLTIAKDVKIQIEFNPAVIKGYRLIGYENRILDDSDFQDDKKDAGDIGAGFTVTAFYELIMTDSNEEIDSIDDLKYQERQFTNFDDVMTIKLRYKEPTEDISQLMEEVIKVTDIVDNPSQNFLFASSVAEFSLLLRDSEYKGNANFDQIIQRATLSKGEDEKGYRSEFIRLVGLAKSLINRE
ncbi:VWA domain-containing protein [Mycoplasmatota bacterium]|nr:VWA domain-containing protein [Mycoplasmatota bacterium]